MRWLLLHAAVEESTGPYTRGRRHLRVRESADPEELSFTERGWCCACARRWPVRGPSRHLRVGADTTGSATPRFAGISGRNRSYDRAGTASSATLELRDDDAA